MKNVKAMTAREFAKFILDHKEDTIEFATTKDVYDTPLESINDCSDWWFVQTLIYSQYQSYNIFIDYCGGGYGVAYSYDDVDFTIDNIQKDLKEWVQGVGTDNNDNKEPVVYVDISPYIKIECIETCPHCDREVEINWCTKEDGYEIYCPYCGKKMLLCDDCMHSPDNKTQKCDWCEETGCFRNHSKKWQIDGVSYTYQELKQIYRSITGLDNYNDFSEEELYNYLINTIKNTGGNKQ